MRKKKRRKTFYTRPFLIFFRNNPLRTIDRIQRGQLAFLKPCEICGGYHETIELAYTEPDNRELILQSIHQGEWPDDRIWIEQALYYGDNLWKGVSEGLRKKELADNKPPSNLNEWLNRQHNNIYRFASAKTFAEQLEYKNAAIDPKSGELRTFAEFKKECDIIGRKYKEQWLQAEYDAVVNGTIQGTNWLDYQDNKDLFPYLQYKIINDDRTRDEHRKLSNIIEHIDSPFWLQYLPQNAWRCRCYVIQLSERMAQNNGYVKNTESNIRKAKGLVDKFWRKNTGLTTLFVEKDTAYFEAFPGKGKKQLSAVKNYGLKSAETLLQNGSLPKPIIGGTKENFQTQWDILADNNGKINVKSKLGFDYVFDDKFKEHIIKSEHEADFPNMISTLKNPDEVWEGILTGRGKRWYRKYIKYYDGGAYWTLINDKGMPVTSYKLGSNLKLEEGRGGILVFKK